MSLHTQNHTKLVTNLTNFEKTCSKESWFLLMKNGIDIMNPKKQNKITVLLFVLYSMWVHVESPKYKMICLKSPKSSEFAIKKKNSGQKSLTMLILSYFNNFSIDFYEIEKFKIIKIT